MRYLVFFLSVFFGLGCSNTNNRKSTQMVETKSIIDTIRLTKLPAIGDFLGDSIRMTSNNRGQLVSSSDLSSSTTILNNGIIFEIAWDKDNRVNYIVTSDSNFITYENVKINMTLKNIKDIQKVDIFEMPGWGYYIKLKSGWIAGFCIGKACTDRELKNDDIVTSIFKR
ncbi:MAG: hypothetical protein EHM93_20175 [Bacteroidales bacterium]|nr:MAG: hypothetical protein EHM93_20175 [Bacteroidales bacterium]